MMASKKIDVEIDAEFGPVFRAGLDVLDLARDILAVLPFDDGDDGVLNELRQRQVCLYEILRRSLRLKEKVLNENTGH